MAVYLDVHAEKAAMRAHQQARKKTKKKKQKSTINESLRAAETRMERTGKQERQKATRDYSLSMAATAKSQQRPSKPAATPSVREDLAAEKAAIRARAPKKSTPANAPKPTVFIDSQWDAAVRRKKEDEVTKTTNKEYEKTKTSFNKYFNEQESFAKTWSANNAGKFKSKTAALDAFSKA